MLWIWKYSIQLIVGLGVQDQGLVMEKLQMAARNMVYGEMYRKFYGYNPYLLPGVFEPIVGPLSVAADNAGNQNVPGSLSVGGTIFANGSGITAFSMTVNSNAWNLVTATNGMANFAWRFNVLSNATPVNIWNSNGVAFVYYQYIGSGTILP